MSYELLLDDRALADRAALRSIVHIVNSVSHYDGRTQAYLSHLLLDPERSMRWIIRIFLEFRSEQNSRIGGNGEKIVGKKSMRMNC